MADTRMPEEFYKELELYLPPEKSCRAERRTATHLSSNRGTSDLVCFGQWFSLGGRAAGNGLFW